MKTFIPVLICCLLVDCGGSDNSAKDQDRYERSKEKLADREKENPLEFLTVLAEKNKNLIGQTVVKGTIENKASVVSYKDVRLKLLYFKAGTQVENHEEEYDAIIRPNNRLDFKTKYFTPKGTDSISVVVMRAEVAD